MQAGAAERLWETQAGDSASGEGDEHSRRLFVADEFARQAGRVEDVRQGRGQAAGRGRRRRVRKYRKENEQAQSNRFGGPSATTTGGVLQSICSPRAKMG
jgi:hypothetical protein